MLGRLFSPLTVLLLLVALHTSNRVVSGYDGEYPSAEADVIYAIGFAGLRTWWVHADRRERRQPVPFEFEAFVFFAWVVVVPVYLIQTRRWWGLPLIGCLYGGFWLPYLAGLALYGW